MIKCLSDNPDAVLMLGFGSDAGEACEMFVRFYDDASWDTFRLIAGIASFRKVLRRLFAEGLILDNVHGRHTYTHKVVANMLKDKVIFTG